MILGWTSPKERKALVAELRAAQAGTRCQTDNLVDLRRANGILENALQHERDKAKEKR